MAEMETLSLAVMERGQLLPPDERALVRTMGLAA